MLVIIGDSQSQVNFFVKSAIGTELELKKKLDPSRKMLSKITLIYSNKGKRSIMFSVGNEIKAVNGVGKEYFCFDSNVMEQIRRVSKMGKADIFTCGEFILNHYRLTKDAIDDVFQFNSPAEILDVFIHVFDGENPSPILSCKVKKIGLTW